MNNQSRSEIWEKLNGKYGFNFIQLRGKIPIEKGWPKYCVEPRKFVIEDFKGCNAGIVCGPASGIIVLDIDHSEKFKELAKKNHWEIPETFTVRTGSGGLHHYYQYPTDGEEYGSKSWKESVGGKKTGVFDVRGVGGQVVAPGSIHPDTRKPYVIEKDLAIAPAPDWIQKYCRALSKSSGRKKAESTAPSCQDAPSGFSNDSGTNDEFVGDLDWLEIPEDKKQLILKGVPKGDRSEAVIMVIDSLLAHGHTEDLIKGIMDKCPIGEKYREKGNSKEKWLADEIKAAREFIAQGQNSEKSHSRTAEEKKVPSRTTEEKKLIKLINMYLVYHNLSIEDLVAQLNRVFFVYYFNGKGFIEFKEIRTAREFSSEGESIRKYMRREAKRWDEDYVYKHFGEYKFIVMKLRKNILNDDFLIHMIGKSTLYNTLNQRNNEKLSNFQLDILKLMANHGGLTTFIDDFSKSKEHNLEAIGNFKE